MNKDIEIKKSKLLNLLDINKCDALLVLNNFNVFYLTSFWDFEPNTFLIISKNKNYIITDGRFTNQIKELKLDYQLINCKNKKSKFEEINNLLDSNNFNNILLSYDQIKYKDILKLRDKKFIDLDNGLNNIRKTKTKEEIKNIKKACEIAEISFLNTIKKIKKGDTEIKIKETLEEEMKLNGSEKIAFPTIVASGKINGAKPHAIPTEREIEYGDLITIDFGATYKKYVSDITRTICVGEINKEQNCLYNNVLNVKNNVEKLLKPGVKARNIHNQAAKMINNYGEEFVHGLGHGIGLEVHEFPVLSNSSDDILDINQIHTIEPGIYNSNVGGVRIEDDYLITENGYKCLTPNITTELIKI